MLMLRDTPTALTPFGFVELEILVDSGILIVVNYQQRAAPNADVKGYANGPDSYWVRGIEVRTLCLMRLDVVPHLGQWQERAAPNSDVKGYANGPDSYWVR